jgi:hypothetical protein
MDYFAQEKASLSALTQSQARIFGFDHFPLDWFDCIHPVLQVAVVGV